MTPIAPTPLDYVPVERLAAAPPKKTKVTSGNVRGALIAAGVAATLVGAFFVAPAACIAVAIVVGAVNVGHSVAAYLNRRDADENAGG